MSAERGEQCGSVGAGVLLLPAGAGFCCAHRARLCSLLLVTGRAAPSHPGTWCHQHPRGFGLFLYWKIKPKAVSIGHIPVLSPAGGRAKPPAPGFCRAAGGVAGAAIAKGSLRTCPQIAKGPLHTPSALPGFPQNTPPCVPAVALLSGAGEAACPTSRRTRATPAGKPCGGFSSRVPRGAELTLRSC